MATRELTDNDKLNIALHIMTDDEVDEYVEVCQMFESGEVTEDWKDVI